MRRIFPAQAPDGFTLVEIVVALAIASVLIYACASALLGSLRAEQATRRARELDLACERVAALGHLGLDPASVGGDWVVTKNDVKFDGKEWTTWDVSAPRSALHGVVAFRN